MPLSIGLGDKKLTFEGVHAIMAILMMLGLLFLTVKGTVGPEAFVGVAVAAINGYLEFRRTNGKAPDH